jgi:hypothetical protein
MGTTAVSPSQPPPAAPQKISRRAFMAAAGGAVAAFSVYSGEIERHKLDITHHTLYIPRLPAAFHGFTIAQISDIHYDNFTEPFFVRRAVAHINALKPDLVVLTGDFISKGPNMYTVAELHSHLCARILGAITCPLRYAILGNHDTAIDPAMVTSAIQNVGIPVLADQFVPIERGASRIWLVGLRDAGVSIPNLDVSIPPAAANEPVITLIHEPDYADDIVASPLGAPTELILSGHSHGGQIRLPFFGPLLTPPLGQKYIEGRFVLPRAHRSLQLYVNRGLGTIAVPLRLCCPPEITHLTLSAQPV